MGTEADDGQKGDQGGWWCDQGDYGGWWCSQTFFLSQRMVCAKRVKLMCVTRPECPKTMKDKVKDKGRRSFIEKNNLQSMFPIFGLQHNEILETEEES